MEKVLPVDFIELLRDLEAEAFRIRLLAGLVPVQQDFYNASVINIDRTSVPDPEISCPRQTPKYKFFGEPPQPF